MYSQPSIPTASTCCFSKSITELLGTLCDIYLCGVSWKRRAVGAVSREGAHRTLKRHVYAILLAKLFQRGNMKPPHKPNFANSTSPRNKILMYSFDLRLSGYNNKADRLENLLQRLVEGTASSIQELDSVLELLVHLAGSVPSRPAYFSQDYMNRELSVQRHPELTGYQNEELYKMESWVWSLMYAEEWRALDTLRRTMGLMDLPPGTGLLALGQSVELEERFGKETRTSLFGALQHTRTSDLEIRLDLPPIPSNIEVTGLAIRVPPCLDQLEDEGFQSASNLTPDSQSEPSPSPHLDMWLALQNFEPGRHRCWENVGCPPGKKVTPYLTEGGREAFDNLYSLREGQLKAVSSSQALSMPLLPLHTQTHIVGDLLNVLLGVASATFPLNQVTVQFQVHPGVCVSGASPESISQLLGEHAQYGTHYLRLSRFSLQNAHKRGLVFQAFTGGLCRYLHYYRACVLSTPPTLSLLTISFLFRKLGRQLRYLSELCCLDGSGAAGQATFPVGVKLLSYLYNEAQSNCSNENYPVLLSLLKSSCEPYTRFVSDWVYSGVFRDVYREFMIQVNEDYLSVRDKRFWTHGYTLISQDVEECVPVFLRHIASDVYVCGKTINLLKICCPQHYICCSEVPVPRIAVTFSLQEVEDIERDCAVYRGRMERIAKHSALSREEQALHIEQARQELIIQVRQSTARTMERIQGRLLSERLVAEAKKRERLEELKEHLEKEQEWRRAAELKRQEDEFSYARELWDRERRLQALEEQLQQRIRKDLISHYSHLAEAAVRREQRAWWRVQRMQLQQARAHFLKEDEMLTHVLLERYLQNNGQELEDNSPSLPSLHPPTRDLQPQDDPCGGLNVIPDSMPAVTSSDLLSSHTTLSISNVPLNSAEVDFNNFILKLAKSAYGGQVDRALHAIGSDLPEANSTFVMHDCDLKTEHDPLRDEPCPQRETVAQLCSTHLSPVQTNDQKPSELQSQTPTADFQVTQTVSCHPLKESENQASSCSIIPVVQESFPVMVQMDPLAEGNRIPTSCTQEQLVHLLNASVTNGGFDTVDQNCASNFNYHASADTKVEQCVLPLETSEHLHCSQKPPKDAHVPAEAHVSVMESPLPLANSYSHASDTSINAGGFMSETPFFGLGCNRQSHSLECSSKARTVTDVGPSNSLPSSIQASLPERAYGQLSDSALDFGCIVKDTMPVQPSLPRSTYGCTSDSSLVVGCVVKGTEPVQAPLPGSAYGHSSDSSMHLGCVVKDTELVRTLLPRSAYGHSSDSTLGFGCVVKDTETVPPVLPRIAYGHSSDSTLGFGCVMKDTETEPPLLPRSAYGHSSDSTLGFGCVVKDTVSVHTLLPRSGHSHLSDSAVDAGCMKEDSKPAQVLLSGSAYGCSSDSALVLECDVKNSEPGEALFSGSAYNHSLDGVCDVEHNVKGSVFSSSSDHAAQKIVLQQFPQGPAANDRSNISLEDQDQKSGTEMESTTEHQLLVDGMSLWASGMHLEENTEQAYLQSLAIQYEVEQYQDNYSLLTTASDSQQLQQVIRGPHRFPGTLDLGRATDDSAIQLSEMVSLPVLMKHSVTTPLITHVSLVNKAVVDYFFVELEVERHFEALRHFLLMEDGEFAQSLSDLLFEKLSSGQAPGELLTPLVLNSILSKALQYSLHGGSALAANFTFALRFLPERFHPHAPDVLSCLELCYKVDWPLNIIITDSCMDKYNRLFSFLLQLKHMVWTLRDVWFHLKRAALMKGAGSSTQFRQLQLYRHEMQHFVKVIQGYIANQILQVSWSEFVQKLGSASDLDTIHHTHADYLNRAIFRGLLTEKAAPVMNIIHSIFSLILKFRAQLIAQPWSTQQGEAMHPSFVAMQQSYNTFKYYSHFLFKVVTKLVNRGYQPHLEDFLLRINFNNYYKDF